MSADSPRIAVVMSTYNGAQHLRQQLDSILAQDAPNVRVYVRDDGSSDDTVRILRDYEERGQITLWAEPNAGVVGSFIDGITRVAEEADYVALCDQDDEWHPDKLSRALSVLQGRDQSIPQLYCAEYIYCDENMNPGERSHLNRIGVTFATMLYENMVSGNTCMMNQTLARMVAAAGTTGVYTHDWWLGLLATALGELSFDDFTCLEYRRTGSNVSPSGSGGIKLFMYRVRTFFQKGELSRVTEQLERLEELYGAQIAPEKHALLERFLRRGRLAKAFTPVRLRQMLRDEVALRLLFLAGLL